MLLEPALWCFTMLLLCRERRSPGDGEDKVWEVKFLRSPVEILPAGDSGRVGGVRLEINKLKVIQIASNFLSMV